MVEFTLYTQPIASVDNTQLIAQLNVNSESYHDPLTHLNWAALSLDHAWLPAEALSLCGIPEFEQLNDAIKRRLTQYEFIHFIQAGLWLESIFLARLGKSLGPDLSQDAYAFNLHEIREEAGHSLMFLKLMQLSGLHLPAKLCVRPRLADWLGRHLPENSLLYWLAVTMGEEIPDRMNRLVRNHQESVNPLIAQMCRSHIIDEARHIARARSELESRLAKTNRLMLKMLTPVAQRLLDQFVRHFYLPQPGVYELVGLSPGNSWHIKAVHNPHLHARITQNLTPLINLLSAYGVVLRAPRF